MGVEKDNVSSMFGEDVFSGPDEKIMSDYQVCIINNLATKKNLDLNLAACHNNCCQETCAVISTESTSVTKDNCCKRGCSGLSSEHRWLGFCSDNRAQKDFCLK